MNRLDLVSTDDLINELLIRFDHVSFAGRRDISFEHVQYCDQLKGDYMVCIGLGQLAINKAITLHKASVNPQKETE